MTWGVVVAITPIDMMMHGWLEQDIGRPCNKWFMTWIEALLSHGHLDMAWRWASVCMVKHIDALERVGHTLIAKARCWLDGLAHTPSA